jgi:hypothetical protein
MFRCFEPISKQPKQTDLFRNKPKQTCVVLDYVPNPPPVVLDKYAAILNNAAPTPTFTDNEGTIRHKKYMFLTFNSVTPKLG